MKLDLLNADLENDGMRTDKEILATAKLCRTLGVEPPPLSDAERARAFGDPRRAHERDYAATYAATIERLSKGLFVSKQDAREARRWLKEQN